MTLSTNINPPLSHIVNFKILTKPLVPMTGLRNQVMEGEVLIATAEFALPTHCHPDTT